VRAAPLATGLPEDRLEALLETDEPSAQLGYLTPGHRRAPRDGIDQPGGAVLERHERSLAPLLQVVDRTFYPSVKITADLGCVPRQVRDAPPSDACGPGARTVPDADDDVSGSPE